MTPYIAIYAILLALLAVGNACFCYICARANSRMGEALRQERARTKQLEISLRNAELEVAQVRRMHMAWIKEHDHRIEDGPGGDKH